MPQLGDNMAEIVNKTEVAESFPASTWQRVVFSEFESTLTSRSRQFPCIFGVTGFKKDQLRFAFPDPLTPESLAPILRDYLKDARSFGRMTSLVVFARPGPVQSIEDYRHRFWDVLDGLERLDETPRPKEIPENLNDSMWEFCFAGEPIFVVCNTPAHVLRQSRRSTSFMITFQPRWVFEGITDTKDPAALRSLEMVRERLEEFDAIAPTPVLGQYGDAENREFEQYFIDDTNQAPGCPFAKLGQTTSTPNVRKGKVA